MSKLLSFVALLALACSDGTGPIDYTQISLSIVSGQSQRDTVMTLLSDPLTVEVMNGENPVPGVLINFVVLDPDCGRIYAPGVLTNVDGRAWNYWELGTLAGPCTVEARAITPTGQPVSYGTFTAEADPGPLFVGYPEGATFRGEGSLDATPRTGMVDQYSNGVHWRIEMDAFAHAMSNDSTQNASRILALDSAGVALARVIYAGQTICRPTVTVAGSPGAFSATIEAPTPARGGCAGTL